MNLKQRKEKLVRKLTNKSYRHSWVQESIKMALPFQIQANREKREWSQEELGGRAGMLRNAVSRLESVEYGNLTINTLLRLAQAFDCGLLVKFVPFSRLVGEFEDVSPQALEVDGFSDDFPKLDSWASAYDWEDIFVSASSPALEDAGDSATGSPTLDVATFRSEIVELATTA